MKKKVLLLIPILLLTSCNIIYTNSSDLTDSSSQDLTSNSNSSSNEESSFDSQQQTSSSDYKEDSNNSSSKDNQEDINYDIIPTKYYTFEYQAIIDTYKAGTTFNLNEYKNYMILDSKGRIVYTVANAGCGHGGNNSYYSHPLYQKDIINYINDSSRTVTIPANCTGYSISFEEYGKYAYSLSNNTIPVNTFEDYGYGSQIYAWNSLANSYLTTANGVKINPAPSITPLPELVSKKSKATPGTPDGNDYFYAANANPVQTSITDGVMHTKYTYSSVNGFSKTVHTVIADLNKVTFELGTPSNSYAPTANAYLKAQAEAYESSSSRKVYAAVNGDFFGAGAAGMPNGFSVKDGVVISNCSPWYESLVNGMWAFSISYNNVASIDKSANSGSSYYYVDNYIDLYNTKASLVKSSKIDAINNKYVYDPNYGSSRPINNGVITKSGLSVSNKNVVYVDKIATYGTGSIAFPFDGNISKVVKNYSGSISLTSNQVALIVDSSFASAATTSHRVRVGVSKSTNEAFSNVKTLIGGRHLLVNNYKEVSTVSNETTNGATSRRARTAVGLMGDGKVMLFVCNESNGLNLKEVADFMAYYGCQIAMNLDGGGSTGLYVRSNNALTLKTGANTRALTNSLLIVQK